MFDQVFVITLLGIIVVGAPVLLFAVMGLSSLIGRTLTEERTGTICQAAIVVGLLASATILFLMIVRGTQHVAIDLGEWVAFPHYHFSVKLVFDRLSVPFVILSFVLCGTISAFAVKYMHLERGYNRFFTLYSLFLLGMVMSSVAGTIETLFFGWEMVGLSSALLIAFFHERPAPVRNGLRVWIVYRVSDAALLLAAIVMHHMAGEGDFDALLGATSWPQGHASIPEKQAWVVGLLLLLAAAGKSALVPFSGWLPRAMEGPTPSSAVFYGALSVHLGVFLLLRVSPIFEASAWLSALVVLLGLTTALYGYIVGTVQTDIKSALSFASLAQVGIIVAEIGVGCFCSSPVVDASTPVGSVVAGIGLAFRYIALVHLLGHACMRTLQFVRAPSLLTDYRVLENAIGSRLPGASPPGGRFLSPRVRTWLYRFALERGYLDAMLSDYLVAPFLKIFRWFDALERRWTDFLAGRASRESANGKSPAGRIEELP